MPRSKTKVASPPSGPAKSPVVLNPYLTDTTTPTMADALQQRTHATAALPAPPAEKNRQQRRILPDTPRAWPHGTWQEATYILGDLGLSIARFVSWCLTGVVRLLFGLLYAIARGFGALFTTISGGRLKQRAALILGWLALAGVLAGSTPWWGNIRTLVVEHWPHATTHFVPVAYVPPPSACVLPRAACAAPTPFLDGQPSITATQILAVLQSYHSPAATSDFAADLYDLGIKYGVNPAYALGFFAEESQCGTTGIAVTTLSLGNVRYTVSNSPVTYTVYNGFRRYATWRDGAEDWYWVIRTYYLNAGIRNIYDVTPIYAPSSDHNDPKNYADTVYQLVQSWAP